MRSSSASAPANWATRPPVASAVPSSVSPVSPAKEKLARGSGARPPPSPNSERPPDSPSTLVSRVWHGFLYHLIRLDQGERRRSVRGALGRLKAATLGKKKPKTVVVVDPDTATLEALCRILDELRFTAVAFVSSVEAKDYILENLGSRSVVLVIASMVMTGLSGMQLLQDIRSLKDEPGHDLPFLLTSSFSKGGGKVSDFQIKNSDGSVVDIVLKPLVSGVVTRKVRELTQREFGDEKRLKASEGPVSPSMVARPSPPPVSPPTRPQSELTRSSDADVSLSKRDSLRMRSGTDTSASGRGRKNSVDHGHGEMVAVTSPTLSLSRSQSVEGSFLDAAFNFSGGVTPGSSSGGGPDWDELDSGQPDNPKERRLSRRKTTPKPLKKL